jgi:hypothetical protein
MLIFVFKLGLQASTWRKSFWKKFRSGFSDVGNTHRKIKHNKLSPVLFYMLLRELYDLVLSLWLAVIETSRWLRMSVQRTSPVFQRKWRRFRDDGKRDGLRNVWFSLRIYVVVCPRRFYCDSKKCSIWNHVYNISKLIAAARNKPLYFVRKWIQFIQEMCIEADERLHDESYYRIADASFFRVKIRKWDIISSCKTQIFFFLSSARC